MNYLQVTEIWLKELSLWYILFSSSEHHLEAGALLDKQTVMYGNSLSAWDLFEKCRGCMNERKEYFLAPK